METEQMTAQMLINLREMFGGFSAAEYALLLLNIAVVVLAAVLWRRLAQLRYTLALSTATLQKNMDYQFTEVETARAQQAEALAESITASVRRAAGEGVKSESGAIIDGVGAQIAPATEDIKTRLQNQDALLEKQGLYMNDRFSSLAAALAALEEKLDAARAGVAKLGEASSADEYERLRADLSLQLAEQAREDRALLQDALNNSSGLISAAAERLTGEVNAKLELLGDKLRDNFSDGLAQTVESFRSLQQQINNLIESNAALGDVGRDVASLSRMVMVKNARESESRLADMLAAALPEEAYSLNASVNGRAAAALLSLPGEEAIAVDDGLDLSDMETILNGDAPAEERDAARRRFGDAVTARINATAEDLIAPPATGNTALMFVASETAFAEIQAHHRDAAAAAAARRVWLMSPTTLLAVLNMARSAMKDYQARQSLREMRDALSGIVREAHDFENRLLEIGDHVGQAMRSVKRAESAGIRLFGRVRGAAGGDNALPAKPPAG